MGARQGVRVVPRASTQLHVPRDIPLKAVGVFYPPQNVSVGVCPLWGHDLPPSPQQTAFSVLPQKIHSLLIPTTEAWRLLQTGGWGLPPAPCLDIWVSLSFHISSQHLKPFFSWQKGWGGGLLLLGLGAVSLASPSSGSPPLVRCSFWGYRMLLVTWGMNFGVPPSPVLFICWRNSFSLRCGNRDRVDGHCSSCCWGWGGGVGGCMCVRAHTFGAHL